MKKKLKFEEMQSPIYFDANQGGFIFQWCCGCGLRHIWHIETIQQDKKWYIKVDCAADTKGTELRRIYERKV